MKKVGAGMAVLAALACSAALLSDYAIELATRLLVLLTLAEAWNLLAGYGGMMSLGTAAFAGIGAYTLVYLLNDHGLPLALALVSAGAVAALTAAVVSRAVFRLRGLYFSVGTLALAEALRLFMLSYAGLGGAAGLFLSVDPPEPLPLFWLALAVFALTTCSVSLATGTRFSLWLRALRDDEDAAAQLGARPYRIKLIAFVLASFWMGVAGAIQGLKLSAVEPNGTLGVHWTIDVISIVIIGGLGLRLGPLIGSVFVVALAELLADYPALHLALTGTIVVLVVRLAPRGLLGLLPRRAAT